MTGAEILARVREALAQNVAPPVRHAALAALAPCKVLTAEELAEIRGGIYELVNAERAEPGVVSLERANDRPPHPQGGHR